MKAIAPLFLKESVFVKKIAKIKADLLKEALGSNIVDKAFLWMPYLKFHFLYTDLYDQVGTGISVLNAFFPRYIENTKNLIYLFRPNFLERIIDEIEGLPLFDEIESDILEKKLFKGERFLNQFIEKFVPQIEQLSRKKQEVRNDIYWQARGGTFVPAKYLGRVDRESEDQLSELNGMKILLNHALNIDTTPKTIQVKEKTLFYVPYLTFLLTKKGEPQYHFYDVGKRGGFLERFLKRAEYDPALSKLCQMEAYVHQQLKKTLGGKKT